MRAHSRFLLVVTLTAALVTAWGASALADNWKKYRGDCDDTAFKTPDNADVKKISRCVKLHLAYRSGQKLDGAYKAKVVSAMKRLYVEGTEKDSKRARIALADLGVTDLPDRGEPKAASKAPAKVVKKSRTPFAPPEPSKGDKRKADRYFKTGIKAYKKKDYDKALSYYMKMVDAAPGYAKGHYNAACIYGIQKQHEGLDKYLLNLSDMAAAGNDEAAKMLKLARKDTDFASIRDESTTFKRLTGYAKIKVVNTLGELGEENVDNLEGSLSKLGHEVADMGDSKSKQKQPMILYASHSKAIAFVIKKLLNHPKTKPQQRTLEQLKSKDGDVYDVVVIWGDDIKKDDEPEIFVPDPDEAEKDLDKLAKTEDEILSHPDDAADEVNEALDAPGETAKKVTDRVDDNLKRPGEAVDRAKETVDKLGETGDRVKGLFD